jgi:hypothetical protein
MRTAGDDRRRYGRFAMKDVEIRLPHRPGALAGMARALGEAGISIEGGGAWVVDARGVGHFLFADKAEVAGILRDCGIEVVAERPVAMLRLDQAVPGQLGLACSQMAVAGVNLVARYSDHDHRLVLVAGDIAAAHAVAEAWTAATR